jgi:hypothetical protein
MGLIDGNQTVTVTVLTVTVLVESGRDSGDPVVIASARSCDDGRHIRITTAAGRGHGRGRSAGSGSAPGVSLCSL